MNFVWSITKWRDYEQCPLMFHNKHILKNFQDRPGPAMARGRDVHKAFEEGVKHGANLPREFAQWEPALDAFEGRKDVFTEYKFGLDKYLCHTNFFSDVVWIRFVLDLFVTDRKNPLIVDYKTGRAKDLHRSDAEFYAAAAIKAYDFPTLNVQYWYIDNPERSFAKQVDLTEAPSIMMRWAQLFQSAEHKIEAGEVPAEKGEQCKWCQVKTCHNYRGA